MNAQEHSSVFVDRPLKVGQLCAVRRAHLAQGRTRLDEHVGHAEITADLDQLAARNDDLAARGKRRQHKKGGRGAVVYDDRGFGGSDLGDETLDVRPARTS